MTECACDGYFDKECDCGKSAVDPLVKPALTLHDVRMWWHKKRSDIPDDDAINFLFREVARLSARNDRLSYCIDRAGLACFMGLGREPEEVSEVVCQLRNVLKEADEYLNINNLTNIAHGSILHQKFKDALAEPV